MTNLPSATPVKRCPVKSGGSNRRSEPRLPSMRRFTQLGEHQQHRRAAVSATHRPPQRAHRNARRHRRRPEPYPARAGAGAHPNSLPITSSICSGPFPRTAAGQAMWRRLADRVETHLDWHQPDGPAWQALCRDLRPAPTLIARAGTRTAGPDTAAAPADGQSPTYSRSRYATRPSPNHRAHPIRPTGRTQARTRARPLASRHREIADPASLQCQRCVALWGAVVGEVVNAFWRPRGVGE